MDKSASRYFLGYPQAAWRVLRAEALGAMPVIILFLLLVWGWQEALSYPPPRGWRTAAAIVLGIFACAAFISLAWDVWTKFGLRVVPQFERPLEQESRTYFRGYALLRHVRLIDELLIQRGLSPLSDLGLAPVEPVGNPGWFDSAAGRRTIAALLANDPPTGLPRKITEPRKGGPIPTSISPR